MKEEDGSIDYLHTYLRVSVLQHTITHYTSMCSEEEDYTTSKQASKHEEDDEDGGDDDLVQRGRSSGTNVRLWSSSCSCSSPFHTTAKVRREEEGRGKEEELLLLVNMLASGTTLFGIVLFLGL